MAEIRGENTSITLQINTSGAWKNMLTFEPEQRAEIMRALKVFAGVLGASTRWCLRHPGGTREWLPEGIGPWTPVSVVAPPLLDDVMVSVAELIDDEPAVFMAYRKCNGKYYISGTADQAIHGVYAWSRVMEAAPAPAAQQATA